MNDQRIRLAVPQDAAALAECQVASWREAYAPLLSAQLLAGLDVKDFQARWQRRLADSRCSVVVAVSRDDIVGLAWAGPSRDVPPVRELELSGLYTRSTRHGSGLGQALFDAAIGDRPCSLWVARANGRARAFYARNGLTPDGAGEVDPALENLAEVRLFR